MFGLTREQSQALDQKTIQEIGIPALVLMETAGAQVAYRLMLENPHRLPTLILSGKVNNGGDGAVLARWLWNHHYPVKLFLLADPLQLKGEALIQWEILQKLPLETQAISPECWSSFQLEWQTFPIWVDALFGTGLQNTLKSPYPDLFHWYNQQASFKVAVDLPSGLCANTGQLLPEALKADLTCTFMAPKIGFFRNFGPAYVGKLQVIDIGIPRHLFDSYSSAS